MNIEGLFMNQLEIINAKKIKKIFIARVCLWIVALAATVYWAYWSFHLYAIGVHDVHEYAEIFRPKFAVSLLISVAAIGVSFILRSISDKLKGKTKED